MSEELFEEKSKIIGQGNYGCSFNPPLSCKDKKLNDLYGNNNYILKVSNDEDIKEELKFSPILQKIDPIQQYFLYIIPTKCSLNIPIKLLENKCKVVKENPKENFNGYFIKYGGYNIRTICKK